MGETFEDLGLRPELARAAADAGFSEPTPLQRATIPVLRRGGNAVIHASSGSGITAAWGLPILDRLAAEGGWPSADRGEAGPGEGEPVDDEVVVAGEAAGGLRALVLAPTPDAAARAAVELAPFAVAAGLRLVALAPGWAPPRGDEDVIIATVQAALDAVEASALKVDGVAAFVVASASSVLALRGADALDTLGASIPRQAQRVLTTGQLTPGVEDYAERHVRKALRIPPRPAEEAPTAQVRAQVDYAVLREDEKLDHIARSLQPGTVLFCRADERAAQLADALTLRGFRVGAAGDADAEVAVAAAGAEPRELDAARPVSYDVPFDAAQLLARHAGRGGAALVLPRELPHLRRIAQEASVALRPAGGASALAREGLDAFRQRLREAVRDEDLEAQLLVLEPLFDEHSPAEIAAAASALLRTRPAAPAADAAGAASGGAGPARPGAGAQRPGRASAGAGAPPDAYTRLFVSVGQRDNVRPGDLVGAIAGEAGIPGERVGRIDVRDTFSIVEVPADAADRVIRAVNGTTIKGRSVRVDYDRHKTAAPRRSGPPGRTRRE